MMQHSPTKLKAYLQEIKARPKKSLSQNFLIDGNILEKMLALADIQEGDFVVEIGPGPGALTEALLKKGAAVLALEKDTLLAENLAKWSRAEILCCDALKVDYRKLLEGKERVKVVANLPYQITTPLLGKLLPLNDVIKSVTVMVQKEVAHRMKAQTGEREYSSLSLFIQSYATYQGSFPISANCFYPKPKVDSAVIRLDLKDSPVGSHEFSTFVKKTFSQRRKMASKIWKQLYSKEVVTSAFAKEEIPLEVRPTELTLLQFLSFFQYFSAVENSSCKNDRG